MAFEISEGAAAGALFLDPATLGSMKVGTTEKVIVEAMSQIHKNLKSKVKMSPAEKVRY